ncbi:hypothetical protein CaCOL14_004813 [Colletotrichum acutatum]
MSCSGPFFSFLLFPYSTTTKSSSIEVEEAHHINKSHEQRNQGASSQATQYGASPEKSDKHSSPLLHRQLSRDPVSQGHSPPLPWSGCRVRQPRLLQHMSQVSR